MPYGSTVYRSLHGYKYKLTKDYQIDLGRDFSLARDIKTPYVSLSRKGKLVIANGYSWDGPSGPTIDTPSFMRGALVHDAMYQLMRSQHLDYQRHRKLVDDTMKQFCLEDGMSPIRAFYTHLLVRMFGWIFSQPPEEITEKRFSLPPGAS